MSAFQLLLFIRKEVLNRDDSLEIYFKSALITRTMRFAPLLEVYSLKVKHPFRVREYKMNKHGSEYFHCTDGFS